MRSSSISPGWISIRGRFQPTRSPEAPEICCQKSAARNLTSAALARTARPPNRTFHGTFDDTFDGACDGACDGDWM
jgi:hypothetical protein